jgi:ADP-heptose:LPS heptosyltransferase
MKKIIISPWSKQLRNGKYNPKNPSVAYWTELVKGLKDKNYYIIQIGVDGEKKLEGVDEYQFNLSFQNLESLTLSVDTWISIDNFYQHFCYLLNKPGFAIFAQSDPLIFGHSINTNILKDRKYLREHQFQTWEQINYNAEAFVDVSEILKLF